MMSKKIVVPGERLFSISSDYESGRGTYATHGHIYSTLAGFLHIVDPSKEGRASIVEVRREEASRHSVPVVGAVVTARVEMIQQRVCKCAILCVEDSVLPHEFTGQIRKEDVRSLERDKVEMHQMFRPRDVILARVISLGDSQTSYQLSTAEDELGVVSGFCEEGHKLQPLKREYSRMGCKLCDSTQELRKVAKVPHLNASQIVSAGL